MNWYKKAKMELKYLGHDSYGNMRILLNGTSYTYYDVSPFWRNKIRWMIEKTNIPHEEIYNKHIKNFSDTERHKKLNPPQNSEKIVPDPPQKPQQQLFPFMG